MQIYTWSKVEIVDWLDKFPTTAVVDKFPKTYVSDSIATTHVETVVKLVKKKPDAYINITVDMDELDLTVSEANDILL